MWAAVIGSPIEHSLSPVLHTAAWGSVGAPDSWHYHRYEVTQDTLPGFMSAREPNMLGLSVTMPLKQAMIPLLDAVDPQAQAVGVVNTVVESAELLTGFNTDVHGIMAALHEERAAAGLDTPHPEAQPAGERAHSSLRAVILGGRATASSALAALGSLGVHDITVAARQFAGPHSVLMAAARLGLSFTQLPWQHTDAVIEAINAADIVISTMPAGVTDELALKVTPRADASLLDIVYSPWHTPLVDAWHKVGGHIVHGSEMLIHQAAQQVHLMTGRTPDIEVMRAALHQAQGE